MMAFRCRISQAVIMKRASKCKLLQISRPHIFPDSALHFPVRGARAKHRAVAQSYVSVRRAAQSHWVIFFPLSPFFLFSSRQLHSRAVRVCARSQMTYYLYSAATHQPGPILTNWRRTMAHFPTLLKSDPLLHCSLPGSHFYVRARALEFFEKSILIRRREVLYCQGIENARNAQSDHFLRKAYVGLGTFPPRIRAFRLTARLRENNILTVLWLQQTFSFGTPQTREKTKL